MLQQDEPDDYVIATGEQHSVREFVQRAFDELGAKIEFAGEGEEEVGRVAAAEEDVLLQACAECGGRNGGTEMPGFAAGDVVVRVDSRYYRPTEVQCLLGDSFKARERLGWRPRVGFLNGLMKWSATMLSTPCVVTCCARRGSSSVNHGSRRGQPVSHVVVTGCAGFVGSHLVDRLLGAGHDVIGIDCLTDYYDPDVKRANLASALDDPRFRFMERDLLDLVGREEELTEVFRDAERVYHLAAQAGVRASWGRSFRSYTDNNVLATQAVLEACVGGHAQGSGVCVVLVGVRRLPRHAPSRRRRVPAGVAVWRDEAGRRASLRPLCEGS